MAIFEVFSSVNFSACAQVYRLVLARPPEAERVARLRAHAEAVWAQGADRRAANRNRHAPVSAAAPERLAVDDKVVQEK
jgi:hypothetical protein